VGLGASAERACDDRGLGQFVAAGRSRRSVAASIDSPSHLIFFLSLDSIGG
jgi:hypothetical protein